MGEICGENTSKHIPDTVGLVCVSKAVEGLLVLLRGLSAQIRGLTKTTGSRESKRSSLKGFPHYKQISDLLINSLFLLQAFSAFRRTVQMCTFRRRSHLTATMAPITHTDPEAKLHNWKNVLNGWRRHLLMASKHCSCFTQFYLVQCVTTASDVVGWWLRHRGTFPIGCVGAALLLTDDTPESLV